MTESEADAVIRNAQRVLDTRQFPPDDVWPDLLKVAKQMNARIAAIKQRLIEHDEYSAHELVGDLLTASPTPTEPTEKTPRCNWPDCADTTCRFEISRYCPDAPTEEMK